MTGAVEIRGASKNFLGVRALDDVSLALAGGEIHALLGEHGAGKSTLIKIITGVHQPDSGTMTLEGRPVAFRSPREAIHAGIGAVHQERNLVPMFSIAENIFLDRLPTRHGLVDRARIDADAEGWLKTVGLALDPRTAIRDLSVAQMQLVEIAKALSLRSRVLLLDEPTASITPHEAGRLFEVLGELKSRGVAMLFVSHKLEEVLAVCDRVTVLRDGRNTALGVPIAGATREDLIRFMIGRDAEEATFAGQRRPYGPVRLQLAGLATAAGHRDIDLAVRGGEIVGLYGMVGCGRSELAKSIIGAIPITGGTIAIDGAKARIRSVADALARFRIGYVSEDRKGEGVVLEQSITANIAATVWQRLARPLTHFLTSRREVAAVRPFAEKLQVRAPSLSVLVGKLSGGNQQKVSVAKWLLAGTEILILDEPTVGIDIGTKLALHDLVRHLAEEGKAILLISSDMPEIIALADRIVVMNAFRIAGEIENSHAYAEMAAGIMRIIHKVDDEEGTGEPAARAAVAS